MCLSVCLIVRNGDVSLHVWILFSPKDNNQQVDRVGAREQMRSEGNRATGQAGVEEVRLPRLTKAKRKGKEMRENRDASIR